MKTITGKDLKLKKRIEKYLEGWTNGVLALEIICDEWDNSAGILHINVYDSRDYAGVIWAMLEAGMPFVSTYERYEGAYSLEYDWFNLKNIKKRKWRGK